MIITKTIVIVVSIIMLSAISPIPIATVHIPGSGEAGHTGKSRSHWKPKPTTRNKLWELVLTLVFYAHSQKIYMNIKQVDFLES